MHFHVLETLGGKGQEDIASRADLHIVQNADAENRAVDRLAGFQLLFNLHALIAFMHRKLVEGAYRAIAIQPFETEERGSPAFEDRVRAHAHDHIAVFASLDGRAVQKMRVERRHALENSFDTKGIA